MSELFRVQKIINKLKVNGVEYFIKWVGYGPRHNTWEPAINCQCEKLINEFKTKTMNKDGYVSRKRKGGVVSFFCFKCCIT